MNKLCFFALLAAIGTLSAAGYSSSGYSNSGYSGSTSTMNPNPNPNLNPNMNPPSSSSYTAPGNTYTTPRMKSTLNDEDASVMDNIRDSLTNFPGISVSVFRGDVTLTGTTGSQMEKDRIERDVRRISGVRTVDNQIKVIK